MYLGLPKSLLWARQIPALSCTSISRQSYPAILSLHGSQHHITQPSRFISEIWGGFLVFATSKISQTQWTIVYCASSADYLPPLRLPDELTDTGYILSQVDFPWLAPRYTGPLLQDKLHCPLLILTALPNSHPTVPAEEGDDSSSTNTKLVILGAHGDKKQTVYPQLPKVTSHFFGWGQWARLEHTESIFFLHTQMKASQNVDIKKMKS